jgi:hypothetical protein
MHKEPPMFTSRFFTHSGCLSPISKLEGLQRPAPAERSSAEANLEVGGRMQPVEVAPDAMPTEEITTVAETIVAAQPEEVAG